MATHYNYNKEAERFLELLSKADFHYGITIDGTACSGKSTFLKPFNGVKVNSAMDIEHMDSFFPATIAYMCKGIDIMHNHPNRLWDRRVTNVLEWALLWQILKVALIYKDHDYTDKSIKDISEKITIDVFKALESSSYMNPFIKSESNFAFVFSDIDMLKSRMYERNNGSDKFRYYWTLYHHLQNVMYKTLYGERALDFHNLDEHYIKAIEDVLKSNLKTDPLVLQKMAPGKYNYMHLNNLGICNRISLKNKMLELGDSLMEAVTLPGHVYEFGDYRYFRPMLIKSARKYMDKKLFEEYLKVEKENETLVIM